VIVVRQEPAFGSTVCALSAVCAVLAAAILPVAAQQAFTGRISDSACGASHQAHASSRSLTDRQCLLACVNALAKYVLVDEAGNVVPIANQDAMGLPLYAGRPVKLTAERHGAAIVVSKIEAIGAHLHLGHVMTNWRDTPGTRGFLPVALDEARVAVLHARLAAHGTSLDDIKLHAGHVLNALDPAIEPLGPGAGYGVKQAVAGAQQHLEIATKADGATANLTTHAAQVSSLLADAGRYADQATVLAQSIRAANDGADGARRAADLVALVERVSDESLAQAQTQMNLILKAENLLGAPR
jgi:hypothetical protein